MASRSFSSSSRANDDANALDIPASIDQVIELAADNWNDARSVATRLRQNKGILVSSQEIKTVAVYHWQIGCGGADEVARSQIKTLSKLGYKVVAITDNPIPPTALMELGFPVSCVLRSFEELDEDSYEVRARAFEACLVDNNVDALIYNQWMSNTALWELLIAKMHGIPTVVCMHGVFVFPLTDLENSWIGARLTELPETLSLADAIICGSETDRVFWGARNPNVFLTRYKSPFVPDESQTPSASSDVGVACLSEETPPDHQNEPRIVWVGRLSIEKRALDAIEIFALVKAKIPGAVLDMVGPYDETWHDAVVQRASQLGVSDSVVLHGMQNDVSPFYRNASLFLHTSSTESYCLSLFEAKSWGLPCVMYELPFLELAKRGERGGVVAVPHRNVDAAADACIRILSDPELHAALGTASRMDMKPFLEFDDAEFWASVMSSLAIKRDLPPLNEKNQLIEEAFRITYDNAIDDVSGKIALLESQLQETRARLNEVETSTTFKVGRMIMALPTRIKDAVTTRR